MYIHSGWFLVISIIIICVIIYLFVYLFTYILEQKNNQLT